ncbi:MAG: hypothetical protein LBU32_19995 [Clostridiales bacterium]|jgi:hypothetical protein|nr:hypothetical protein [Clostridiales bacterium]
MPSGTSGNMSYTTIPDFRSSYQPPNPPTLESGAGAYYYKYSFSWAIKSASTGILLKDAQMKLDSVKKNNAYIFMSCIGTASTPPEFGIISGWEDKGSWFLYTRASGGDVSKKAKVIEPDSATPSNGIYTYKNSVFTNIRIYVSGDSIKGEVRRGPSHSLVASAIVSGVGTNIGTSCTFLLGVSYCPNPATTSPGPRNAYLKHVYLQDGFLYSEPNYSGNSTLWEPDKDNQATYYSLLCRTNYVTYNRFGITEEEISIDYN